MFSLEGKVAVVTGGVGGIGQATVRRFAQAGAKVVIADVDDGSALAKEVDGLFVHTDVSDEEQVKSLMDKAVEEYGRLDIAINNAGKGTGGGLIRHLSADAIRRSFDTNALGAAWGIKHASPHMKDGGAIVNTASLAGIQGQFASVAYVAAKFAVVGITKTNAMTPLGRPGKPEEVAALFHFLVADDCPYITGQAICIDGGMTAGPLLRLNDLGISLDSPPA